MNIQQLRTQIAALQDATMDENKNFRNAYDKGKFDALSAVDALLDFLQEEPVSNDLEEAAKRIATRHSHITGDTYYANDAWFFKKGAQWQKANLWKDAQGDDLPEIDREVVVLYQPYPCGGNEYAVSFAHRPSEYWDLKNKYTGEITRLERARYGKGGWNITDVKFWLDCDLHKMED